MLSEALIGRFYPCAGVRVLASKTGRIVKWERGEKLLHTLPPAVGDVPPSYPLHSCCWVGGGRCTTRQVLSGEKFDSDISFQFIDFDYTCFHLSSSDAQYLALAGLRLPGPGLPSALQQCLHGYGCKIHTDFTHVP